MNDLSASRAQIDWANAQVDILAREIQVFMTRKPYRFRQRSKPHLVIAPDTTQADLFAKGRFLELVLLEDIPDSFKVSAGMIIQALRNSLDHLTQALANKNDGGGEDRETSFPFAGSKAEFDREEGRRLQRLALRDRDLIHSLQPYRGGNDLLFSLNWLCNKSKHRNLIAIATEASGVSFVGNGCVRGLLILPPGNTLCPTEQLIYLGADPGIELDAAATIAFQETGHIPGKPIVEALREFAELTRRVTDQF
jgi:hypothetical protein